MPDDDLQEIWRDVRAKPKPRVYSGHRSMSLGKCVVKVTRNGRTTSLRLAKNVLNHSPTGFEWGYPGSGPAQLALAILVDLLGKGHRDRAIKLHQGFKRIVVEKLPHKEWTLTSDQILEVVARLEGPGKGGDRGG